MPYNVQPTHTLYTHNIYLFGSKFKSLKTLVAMTIILFIVNNFTLRIEEFLIIIRILCYFIKMD